MTYLPVNSNTLVYTTKKNAVISRRITNVSSCNVIFTQSAKNLKSTVGASNMEDVAALQLFKPGI